MQTEFSSVQPVIRGPWLNGPIRSYSNETAALIAEDCNDAVHFFYPDKLRAAAACFTEGFAGKTVYAVKANPSEIFLLEAWRSGVRAFDVASIREVEALKRLLPEAELMFMHPVKSRQAIRRAFALGVRAFALDSLDELYKILEETDYAKDLTLLVRVGVAVNGAAYELKGKFGAPLTKAVDLVKAVSRVGRLGLCFHVGSQCMNPHAFRDALQQLSAITLEAGIQPSIIDVGGGFPVSYPGMDIQPLETYFDVIHTALKDFGFGETEVWCEPGRALVAEAGATAARVELRKDKTLYLNDGTYGALFDAGSLTWPFAVRLLRPSGAPSVAGVQAFDAYGPTCDSIDYMAGPFHLPIDTREGDWVVFENLGSYGQTMQSRFNGFYSETCVSIINDGALQEQNTPVLEAIPA